jgi:DNA-binding NarL/FixJ family response regulator
MHLALSPTPHTPQPASRLRVVIADPDSLVRRTIRDTLQALDGFVVAAEAVDGVEALELCRHYRPELLISEVALPRIDGIALARTLSEDAPEVRMMLFAVSDDPELKLRALRAGACGYIEKTAGTSAIGPALAAVARGEAAISRQLTMRLIEQLRQVPEAGTGVRPVKSNLTNREWEVLDLLVSGATTQTIAAELFLTGDTVYSHVKSIMRKLNVRSRQDAIEAAQGLVGVALAA